MDKTALTPDALAFFREMGRRGGKSVPLHKARANALKASKAAALKRAERKLKKSVDAS